MSASVRGIDLGATTVAVGQLREGQLGEAVVQPTERSDSASLIDQLAAMVVSARTGDLVGVGIGVPRIVEFESGRVVSTSRAASPATNGAVDLPLADVPLRSVLEDRLGVPVFVDNDANVMALAEAHDEQLELVARHLVMFTFGTHVGGGLVLGGRMRWIESRWAQAAMKPSWQPRIRGPLEAIPEAVPSLRNGRRSLRYAGRAMQD